MLKIDSHHHFWTFTEADYGWIEPAWTELRRDFLPADLEREITRAGIDGVVSVEAHMSVDETRRLLTFAAQHAFIRGVVGWAPLVDPRVGAVLDEFAGQPKLRGIRHVLQCEPDGYMLRDDFNRGIAEVTKRGLVFDICIFEKHLPQAIEFVDRHPNQVFVLDHIAKPRIRDGVMEPWRTHIRELARRPHVFCKASGMVTEADPKKWDEGQLWPYFDTVVECFGAKRLMFGTDWPVCLLGSGYRPWFETVVTWLDVLPAPDQAEILGGTAMRAYGLK
ncbi:MAG: amidohydrolase family protein [Opitutaceae bacterium]|nr:amidohydrolase family protein [Opitutaceae bacterium]